MKIRFFFFALFLSGLLDAKEPPPHLFIYLSDDHSQSDSSLYGARDIPTPEMEKLAEEGMTFTHCFVASPSCAPSRAALLTGLMPARNGAEANHTYPEITIASLIDQLRVNGYDTAAIGKVAHGKSAKRFGFDTVVPARDHETLVSEVTGYLEGRSKDKPLAMFVGTSNPHVPWPMENEVDPKDLILPPIFQNTKQTRLERAAYIQEILDLDQLLGDLRKIAAEHLGQNVFFLHSSDHGSQWPFGKWNLYDYGTRVPLIISWPKEIEKRSVSEAMVSWVDILPTLLEVAGAEVPEEIDGKSFWKVLSGDKKEHRDYIFTTHSGDGNKNIYPIRSVRTPEWKLIQNLRPELAHTTHSDLLRKFGAGYYWSEWAFLYRSDSDAAREIDRYFRRPPFELYHVSVDRWETRNLIDDPAQYERIAKLKKELTEWRNFQGDTGEIFNEPRPLDRPESWHPDFFGRHEGIDPDDLKTTRKKNAP